MSDRMVEKLTEKLTKMVSRRGILASLSAGAVALASSLFGKAKASAAYVHVACCWLCATPSVCSSCNCTWEWACFDERNCRTYSCIECYMVSWPCNASCTNVKCSQAKLVARGC
jgi:hypothetical protein